MAAWPEHRPAMQNFLDPAILFFVFGLLAGLSVQPGDPAADRALLVALPLDGPGPQGRLYARQVRRHAEIAVSLGLALLLAVLVPAVGYLVLRRLLSPLMRRPWRPPIWLGQRGHLHHRHAVPGSHAIAFGGHMAAAMALMESPAIVMAVLLANLARRKEGRDANAQLPGLRQVLHESFTDGAQLLLLGAMVVGLVTGESGQRAMQPFSGDLFKGMLAFFLLDMGLARRTQPGQPARPLALAAGLCAGRAAGARQPGAEPRGALRPQRRQCHAADGVGRQCLLHRRACRGPRGHPRGQPFALLRHVAGADLSVQHPGGHSAVCSGGAAGDVMPLSGCPPAAAMQALLDLVATLDKPHDAARVFHGRGGLHPGCEHLALDAYPPVWLLTSYAPVSDEDLARFWRCAAGPLGVDRAG